MSAAEPGLVLGIDTATPLGGIAIAGPDGLIAEHAVGVQGSHASRLMAALERLLGDAGLSLADLAGIGVSIGPGSFTGLRVGVASAMGLARAQNLPLLPVPTLEALAWGVPRPAGAAVATVLTARRDEVYGAVFGATASGGLEPLLAPCAVAPAALLAELNRLGRPLVLAGSGTPALLAAGAPARGITAAPAVFWQPRAAVVAWRAGRMLAEGRRHAPHEVTPIYLKASQAEINWAKRQRTTG
ncbi:MAG: tRNA (adenosine(37)-N6)-threonylcarbamoyltransferase complex dimerization subunit type 1 TsaB [Nitrospirae bacterium]|nr:tRNA (adenosine(37)-N6)-threonylcarbamoyltransferase complex dimerization subunit type 1 TsaB [Nitrospirota bacterium]